MELKNRPKQVASMKSAVARVFKDYSQPGTKMPAWGMVKSDLVSAVMPVMQKIQTEAIRAMFAKWGDGPAPAAAKPEALERAQQMAEDLAAVSIRRWKKLGTPPSPQQALEWYAQNFGKDRIKNIAITEVTLAHQTGEDIAWRWLKKAGVKLEGIWRCESNPCKHCKRMNGKKSKYWRRFFPAGPPSPHPSCQCWIEHIRV
jgi:hypothetical protein